MDVNGDGSVTSLDAAKILARLSGRSNGVERARALLAGFLLAPVSRAPPGRPGLSSCRGAGSSRRRLRSSRRGPRRRRDRRAPPRARLRLGGARGPLGGEGARGAGDAMFDTNVATPGGPSPASPGCSRSRLDGILVTVKLRLSGEAGGKVPSSSRRWKRGPRTTSGPSRSRPLTASSGQAAKGFARTPGGGGGGRARRPAYPRRPPRLAPQVLLGPGGAGRKPALRAPRPSVPSSAPRCVPAASLRPNRRSSRRSRPSGS